MNNEIVQEALTESQSQLDEANRELAALETEERSSSARIGYIVCNERLQALRQRQMWLEMFIAYGKLLTGEMLEGHKETTLATTD